ncbi:hypothetical protein GCM10027168_05990 [Streptomyces capparidis]
MAAPTRTTADALYLKVTIPPYVRAFGEAWPGGIDHMCESALDQIEHRSEQASDRVFMFAILP